MKKYVSLGIGLALFIAPLGASAQTASGANESSLIAALQQLVVILTQELEQLLALHSKTAPPTTVPDTAVNLTATPTSGVAPLTVKFSWSQYPSGILNFGDGNWLNLSTIFGNGAGDPAGFCGAGPDFFCTVPHTYKYPGTFTATLSGSCAGASSNMTCDPLLVASTKVIVTNGGYHSTQTIESGGTTPATTIDQSALTSASAFPVITGSARGLSSVYVVLSQYSVAKGSMVDLYSASVPVVNDSWSFTPSASNAAFGGPQGLSAGTYNVIVYQSESSSSSLATGTLTVASGGHHSIQEIQSGGTAVATTIGNTATQYVYGGGIARQSVILSGGTESVFSGGTTADTSIAGGLLRLQPGAISSGAITFTLSGGTLEIDAPPMPSSTIYGFGPGDTIDLPFVSYTSAVSASLGANNVLTVHTNGSLYYTLTFDPSANFSGKTFTAGPDANYGTSITLK